MSQSKGKGPAAAKCIDDVRVREIDSCATWSSLRRYLQRVQDQLPDAIKARMLDQGLQDSSSLQQTKADLAAALQPATGEREAPPAPRKPSSGSSRPPGSTPSPAAAGTVTPDADGGSGSRVAAAALGADDADDDSEPGAVAALIEQTSANIREFEQRLEQEPPLEPQLKAMMDYVIHRSNLQLLQTLKASQADMVDVRRALRHQRNELHHMQQAVDSLSTHLAEETEQRLAAERDLRSQLVGAGLKLEELTTLVNTTQAQLKKQLADVTNQVKQLRQQQQRGGGSGGQQAGTASGEELQQMQAAITQLQQELRVLEQTAAAPAPAAEAATAAEGPLAALAERLDRVEGVAASAAAGHVTDGWRVEMQQRLHQQPWTRIKELLELHPDKPTAADYTQEEMHAAVRTLVVTRLRLFPAVADRLLSGATYQGLIQRPPAPPGSRRPDATHLSVIVKLADVGRKRQLWAARSVQQRAKVQGLPTFWHVFTPAQGWYYNTHVWPLQAAATQQRRAAADTSGASSSDTPAAAAAPAPTPAAAAQARPGSSTRTHFDYYSMVLTVGGVPLNESDQVQAKRLNLAPGKRWDPSAAQSE